MKTIKVLFIVSLMVIVASAYSQRPSRGDACRQIPDLTKEQKEKIDKLSSAHQKSMDDLRAKLYAENDALKASEIKSQMAAERANHYRNISVLLTPAQKACFDNRCFANFRRGYGRGMGDVPGMGYGCCMGYGRSKGYGRGWGKRRFMHRCPYQTTDIP